MARRLRRRSENPTPGGSDMAATIARAVSAPKTGWSTPLLARLTL
jgi:hypothetical protein